MKRLIIAVLLITVAAPAAIGQHAEHGHGHEDKGHHGREPDAHPHGHGHHHRFENAEEWAERFDDPARDEWQKPAEVLKLIELESGLTVADIGSATGYFAMRLAPMVAPGRVWGIDIEPDMVRYLNERGRDIDNLFSILGQPDDPLLPEPADRILIVDTYHHIADRIDYFTRLRESLADRGRLYIVDFIKGDLPVGPSDAMKLAPDQVVEELGQAGWIAEILDEPLPYQYVVVAR